MGVFPFAEIEQWQKEKQIKAHPADLVFYPAESLKARTILVPEQFPIDQLKFFSAVLVDRMLRYKGVGLAAPQIGLPFKWAVIDKSGKGKEVKVLINPEITSPVYSGEASSLTSSSLHRSDLPPFIESVEGCLSCPGFQGKLLRTPTITVKALDENRQEVIYDLEGTEAIIAQHEIDHLNGLCIVDRSPRLQRIHYLSLIKR